MVEAAKEAIRAGEVFQVVRLPALRRSTCPADALDVYRVLRRQQPQPVHVPPAPAAPDGTAYDVVGSSPEALVKVTGRRAITHPIAGSRPRGTTPEEDVALAEELLADAKERAEHLMLVDLARNDLGRVCARRHRRRGRVHDGRALQPHHAPRVRPSSATSAPGPERPTTCCARRSPPARCPARRSRARWRSSTSSSRRRRGLYGGVVGYLDFAGDLDMAIAIRTAVLKDGRAYVQAGGGIVADSVPQLEHEESVNKAAAALRAVATAAGLRAP